VLTVSGFGQEKHNSPLLTDCGKISYVKDGVIFYDIDTSAGLKGSPVQVLGIDNKVVAIHQDFYKDFSTSKVFNFGILITTEVIERVNKWCFKMNPHS